MAGVNRSSNAKDSNKKDKVADSLRDEMELVTAASMELQKLKRQLRQTRAELSTSKIASRKTIQRQNKGIELLEKEKADCEAKLSLIKAAQKPPPAVHRLISKYHQALQQLEHVRQEFHFAKTELSDKEKKRSNTYRSSVTDVSTKSPQDKLDQVMLQYNKILAKNVQLRMQLEEMMKVKEEFIKNLKQLQNERSQVRITVDRLYEENTTLFLQREEFRLKLNLLREKLETTRIQGQRDLREYRRLLNNDEKLNSFLEMKNQERLCIDFTNRTNVHPTSDDHIAVKVVEEWRETLLAECGHCNFGEIVQQYLHNLEQGYVMYGLIAQKNNEIDRLEDEISDMEQSLEHRRTKSHQRSEPASSNSHLENRNSSIMKSPHKQDQELSITSQFVAKFQKILNSMELQITLTEEANPMFCDLPKMLEQCNLGCTLLTERTTQLVASVTSTDSMSSKQQSWDYPAIPPLATSRSSNSTGSYESTN
ncbi:girdin homolog [Daphnia carinata]|uniref:girdin homolog n=1 Tax=Daphnia carinata TaxID=120202 RepID=UPI0025801248|nr:girdin homolog [Daphnia carinata]